MLAIAGEELVGAHARQQDLHTRVPRRLAHEQRVDRAGVPDRFVEDPHQPGQHVDHVGGDLDLVQLDVVHVRHDPCELGVVGHRLETPVLRPEGDRVGLEVGNLASRQHGDDARIEATGQKGRDRYVGNEMGGNRRFDDLGEVGPFVARRLGSDVRSAPVGPHAEGSVRSELGPGAGLQLAHTLYAGGFVRDPPEQHRGHQSGRIHAQLTAERRHNGFHLGREDDTVLAPQIEQRLDPQLVAGQEHRSGRGVEQGEGEHAPEPGKALRAPRPPRLEDDLGVRRCFEADPCGSQLRSDITVVVELSVVTEGESRFRQWLMASGEVDDRESSVGQMHVHAVVREREEAAVVRTTVGDRLAHRFHGAMAIHLLVGAGNAAHRAGSVFAMQFAADGSCPSTHRYHRNPSYPESKLTGSPRRPSRSIRRGGGVCIRAPTTWSSA